MLNFLWLWFVSLILNGLLTAQQLPTPTWPNVNYAGNNHTYHMMDIYLPDDNRKHYPAVVVIYGSAWTSNDEKLSDYQKEVFVMPLAKKGFATVAINHRSSTLDAVFPAQIHDVKAVIRFLRARAEDFKIDPSFIGIAGYSSGGHLAALAGTSSNNKSVEGAVGEYLTYPSHVDAVVDFYGPTDLSVFYDCPITSDKKLTMKQRTKLFGEDIYDIPDKVQAANPVNYIDENTPPFLIFQGAQDRTVPICQSQLLHEALLAKNIESQLLIKEDGDHCGNNLMPHHTKQMAAFFHTQYKKQL